jgi:serine phosphatase RsbU (regulator of sigma subunit)
MSRLAAIQKLISWLDRQAKLRKDEFVSVGTMSRSVRIGGALIPALAFFIVVFQVYSSADEDSIIAATGVKTVHSWKWDVQSFNGQEFVSRECHEQSCWTNTQSTFKQPGITLPDQDPVGSKQVNISAPQLFVYRIDLSRRQLQDLKASTLYIPGIRARQISFRLNQKLINISSGDLPYFVDLGGADQDWNQLEIAATYESNKSYQGFIRNNLFVGDTLSVYRTHYRLTFKSFPRNAVIIFLLSIGALTFAFFIFLDHKQELFALGLTVSLQGAAWAVLTGMFGSLQTSAFFVIFAMHITALCWYASEMIRINVGLPTRIFAGGAGVIAIYFATLAFDEVATKPIRVALLTLLDSVPLVIGPLCLAAGGVFFSRSRERSMQLIISGVGMIAYGLYLLGNDHDLFYSSWLRKTYEIPLLAIVTSWVISALSSLGSMERRVQIAVKDREQRLKLEHEIVLAQEVQQSFILSGHQPDENFEVHTIYHAVKRVGGDWVTWRKLNDEMAIGIIGDVVGKGVQAGLIVSACDSSLRLSMAQFPTETTDPSDVIRRVVQQLHQSVIAPHARRAMTLAILVVHRNGEIAFSTLGHPPLLLVSPEGSKPLVVRNGWLSPDFDTSRIQIGKIKLEPHQTIVGYTDGVCDGSRQLREFRQRVADWHQREFTSIDEEFSKVEPDYDDQTLLLVRFKRIEDTKSIDAAS